MLLSPEPRTHREEVCRRSHSKPHFLGSHAMTTIQQCSTLKGSRGKGCFGQSLRGGARVWHSRRAAVTATSSAAGAGAGTEPELKRVLRYPDGYERTIRCVGHSIGTLARSHVNHRGISVLEAGSSARQRAAGTLGVRWARTCTHTQLLVFTPSANPPAYAADTRGISAHDQG